MKNLPRPALLALATLLLTTQCAKSDEPVAPANLLPRAKMVAVLMDLHVLEARVEASRLPTDSARVLFRQTVKDIYWQHETDEPAFRQSMNYYAIHGKDLEEIYFTVNDSLMARQARLQAQQK